MTTYDCIRRFKSKEFRKQILESGHLGAEASAPPKPASVGSFGDAEAK